jgi:hypothetical protein
MTIKQIAKAEAKEFILKLLSEIPEPKNRRLLIFIKSTSASGMMRKMKVLLNDHDITYYVNDLLEYNHPKDIYATEYIKVGGCGMDMTFWLADNITYHLWPERETRPEWLTGNGGGCLEWKAIY